MPFATVIQLLPSLLSALAPLLQAIDGAHAANDVATAQAITADLANAWSLATQAADLVATCERENRDPTPAEWAPFDAAMQAAQAKLAAALQATAP